VSLCPALHSDLFSATEQRQPPEVSVKEKLSRMPSMHEIIYLVGLVVVVMFVLSLLGLR
jgi:hypothetical protein